MIKNRDLAVTLLHMATAQDRSRPVTITYQKEGGSKVETRTVEITDVHTSEGGDYLITGWCRTRGAERTFRVDRVTHYTVHRGGRFCGAHVAFLAQEGEGGYPPIPPYTPAGATEDTPAMVGDKYALYADYLESRGYQEQADWAWGIADRMWGMGVTPS